MANTKGFNPSTLAQATKRLYEKGKINIGAINKLKEEGQITNEEYNWILGK